MPATVEAQTLANVITNIQHDYYNREIDRLAANIYNIGLPEPIPHPPSLNDRLCAKIMDATGSQPTFAILMEAYQTITFGADEPNEIWSHPAIYVALLDLFSLDLNYRAYIMDFGVERVEHRFLNATLHRDQSMPATEILIFNSLRPKLSIRIIHLGATNDQES
jgi:hypothetical protein